MKRFHVRFRWTISMPISILLDVFGMPPTVRKPDYAKWMVDDPRVNFAISKRGLNPGVDHLGIQVESTVKLAELRKQVAAAEISALDQTNTVCCYARSDKYWINDPQGIASETFHTLDSVPVYGQSSKASQPDCCSPTPKAAQAANSNTCCP
jgi:hypothetical protein